MRCPTPKPCPPAWRPKALKVAAAQDAPTLLRPLKADHTAMAGLRRALQAISLQINPTDETVVTSLAEALATQKAWIIRNARKPVAPVFTTDPAVCAAVNAEGGTSVDFARIAHWEGNQMLRGYIPFSKNGTVAGISGMSVATAFDVGQIDSREFKALNLPASLMAKLEPFVGLRFGGKARNDVARVVANKAPVPVLTKAEADATDHALFENHLSSAIKSWNARRKMGVPEFKHLPQPWQTVLFSRTFHQGITMPTNLVSQPFYPDAVAGNWKEAADALQAYRVTDQWYRTRVTEEAALLRTDFPPTIKPLPPAGQGGPKP